MREKSNKNQKKYDGIFLEKPISNANEDVFGISPYAEQLYTAIENEAKFIAIDGQHGSGKSSLINMVNDIIKKPKKKHFWNRKQKNFFVNINFLNINESSIESNEIVSSNEIGENCKEKQTNQSIINKYHRYFVNQVANDLYRNPYDIEKLFYNNFFVQLFRKKKKKIIAILYKILYNRR